MGDTVVVDEAQLRYVPDGQFAAEPAAQESGRKYITIASRVLAGK